MAREIIWGILPDGANQPRIEFGQDTQTDKAYLSVNGNDITVNLQDGAGTYALQQVADGVAGGFNFAGKNANAISFDASLNGMQPYGGYGAFSSAFGGKSSAQGKRSFACGTTTIAKGAYSFVSGDNSVALGNDSHAEGYKTTALATGSHAEGTDTVAGSKDASNNILGAYSHAEGIRTKALKDGAHAEGCDTEAGEHAHAEGTGTHAIGVASHAEGFHTFANGPYSHAEGSGCYAYGPYSHAQGLNSTVEAVGEASSAMGKELSATQVAQTVVGQFNDFNFSKNGFHSVFQVGCGSEDDARLNGLNIAEGGEIIIHWNNAYYVLQAMFNLISNANGGPTFFSAAKVN